MITNAAERKEDEPTESIILKNINLVLVINKSKLYYNSFPVV